jgi:hypothetical protein
MTPFGQPKFTLVKTPLKNPWLLIDPPMSSGTFAAFSKFSLNTSNSTNTKVVCFVEGHVFHVEWHRWFGVEMGEKFKSTLVSTIHKAETFCILASNLCKNFSFQYSMGLVTSIWCNGLRQDSRSTQDTFYNQDDPSIREAVLDSRLGGSVPRVLWFFLWILRDRIGRTSDWPSAWIYDST